MEAQAQSGKINLAKFKHAIIPIKDGDEAIIIPIKGNKLYKSEVGNVFFDWIAWPKKTEDKEGNTHMIKQSFSKTEIDAMSKEQKEELPIYGNMKPFGGKQEAAPVNDQAIAANVAGGIKDLPF
jgi:hypothetical protein